MNKKIILSVFSVFLLVACNQTQNSSNSNSLSDSSSNASTSSPFVSDSSSTGSSSNSSSSGGNITPSKTVEKAIEDAITKQNAIKSGTIHFEEQSYSTSSYDITYEYGQENFFYFTEPNYANEILEFYLIFDSNQQIIPIQVNTDSSLSKPYETYDSMGYRFDNEAGYDVVFIGVEDLISGLYEIGAENRNQDFAEGYASGNYFYQFGYLPNPTSYYYYEMDIEFKIGNSDEFCWAKVVSQTYNNSNFIYDDELGVVQLLPNATVSSTYTYEIEQEIGTRTKSNPYPYESLKSTSFDLMYQGSAILENQVIEMEVGYASAIQLSIDNILPTTASFSFDTISYLVNDGTSTDINIYYNSFSNVLEINATASGTYTVKVNSTNVEKNFTLNVKEAQPKTISVTYYMASVDGYNSDVLSQSLTIYKDVSIYFLASILPYEASQEFQVTISGQASNYEMQETTIQNNFGMEMDTTEVVFLNTGTYTLTFSSVVNTQVTHQAIIQVVERPAMSEILVGEFGHKSMGTQFNYLITFTPIGDGMTGTASLKDNTLNSSEEVTYQVVLREDGKYDIEFSHVSGDTLNFELVMGPNYDIVLYVGINSYNLDKVTPETVIATTWEATLPDGTIVSFGFSKNGVVNVMAMNFETSYYYESFECFYSVEEVENGYEITFTASSYTPAENSIISFDEVAIVAKDYSTLTVNIYCTGTAQSISFVPMG